MLIGSSQFVGEPVVVVGCGEGEGHYRNEVNKRLKRENNQTDRKGSRGNKTLTKDEQWQMGWCKRILRDIGTKRRRMKRGNWVNGADSQTMQCGTVCTLRISALIQLSLIDINWRVAKLRHVDAECGNDKRRRVGVRREGKRKLTQRWLRWNICAIRSAWSVLRPSSLCSSWVQLTLFVIWSRTFEITKCTTTSAHPTLLQRNCLQVQMTIRPPHTSRPSLICPVVLAPGL